MSRTKDEAESRRMEAYEDYTAQERELADTRGKDTGETKENFQQIGTAYDYLRNSVEALERLPESLSMVACESLRIYYNGNVSLRGDEPPPFPSHAVFPGDTLTDLKAQASEAVTVFRNVRKLYKLASKEYDEYMSVSSVQVG